jgi:hypothetical protein
MAWICSWFLWNFCLRCSLTSERISNFWLLKTMLWPPSLLTGLICPFVISSCFQEWNCCYKGTVSSRSLKFKNNHWPFYMRFQKVSSSRTSIYSRNAGLDAWTWKLATLKVTTTSNARKCIFCYWIGSETSGYTAIISKWCKDCYTLKRILQPLQCKGLGRVVLSIWSFMCFIKSALLIQSSLFSFGFLNLWRRCWKVVPKRW